MLRPQARRNFFAVHAGHAVIENDGVNALPAHNLKPSTAIPSDENPKPLGLEQQLADVQAGGVVINAQDDELVGRGQESIA